MTAWSIISHVKDGLSMRAYLKFTLFILITVALLPLQLAWLFIRIFSPTYRQSPIVRLWFYLVMRLINISVSLIGRENLAADQKIILSNHISYLDILILGYLFDAFFVAKSDIANWPVFGFLSKISSVIFISRKPMEVKNQIIHLKNHLDLKKSLIVFPEGTTSNGRKVLPFKAGFLNALTSTLEGLPALQPVTLTYIGINGRSLQSQDDSDKIAWYADMTLAPHLWTIFKQDRIDAIVQIHPCLTPSPPIEPKKIAQEAQAIVASGFADHWAKALQEYSHSGQE